MRRDLNLWLSLILGAVFASACSPSPKVKKLMEQSRQVFGQLPKEMPGGKNDTPALVALGKKLYFEKRLSVNDSQSCNSCHLVDSGRFGVDNLPTSPGAKGKNGDRNSPTVLNAGFHIAQFWDGRAPDLKEQAKGPILNPIEMGMPSEKAVIDKISKIPEYVSLFKKAYPNVPDSLSYDRLANAIAAFERTLITRDRFDDFMNGDGDALSNDAQQGLRVFMSLGCTACHSGNLLGGRFYRKIGLVNEYKNKKDLGRFKVTKQESDKYMFKVPSLRNVANTAPYFHDGSAATLKQAIRQMAHLQLGRGVDDQSIDLIIEFFKSLSDKKRS